MKVFWSNDFKGIWPVPVAAVMVATSKDEAIAALLEAHPMAHEHEFSVHELDTSGARCVILSNGDY